MSGAARDIVHEGSIHALGIGQGDKGDIEVRAVNQIQLIDKRLDKRQFMMLRHPLTETE